MVHQKGGRGSLVNMGAKDRIREKQAVRRIKEERKERKI
jgi:hypothetical protein